MRLAAFVALAGLVLPAHSQETSRNAYYPVKGHTAKEIYDDIKMSSPKIAPNSTFAFTTIATKTDSTAKQAGDACRFSKFKTSAIYIFNLPQHVAASGLQGKTRAKWQGFVAYLQTHEEGHRDMWRKCFADYDQQALQLEAATCPDLAKKRDKLFTAIKKKCVAQDEAYDVIFRREVLQEPFVKEALAVARK